MALDDIQSPVQEKPEGGGAERTPSPPYVSFLTFKSLLDWLRTEGVPLRFDRSFWEKKFGGSTGTQLMSALRFLGLLKGDEPQPELESLVQAGGDDRKEALKAILKRAYTRMNFEDLQRATPAMLAEWLGSYGSLTGDTLRKAESFLINACKEAGVPLSKAVHKKARNRPPTSGKATATARKGGKTKDESPFMRQQDERPHGGGEGRNANGEKTGTNEERVVLDSGGIVSLSLAVGWFSLSVTDREFVLKLVDLVKEYRKAHKGKTIKTT